MSRLLQRIEHQSLSQLESRVEMYLERAQARNSDPGSLNAEQAAYKLLMLAHAGVLQAQIVTSRRLMAEYSDVSPRREAQCHRTV